VSARRLPIPGPPPTASGGRHVIRTLDDAIALREALVPGAKVVVLGAGFIGCEVAATAIKLGCEATCVAIDPYPMIRPLGPELAAELQRRHEAQGVVFHLGVGVTEFVGGERVTGVVLSDGTVLEADVVLEALGSRCNVEWLDGNGLDLADGVRTDSALRPVRDDGVLDGVAIVGDIARFPNLRFDERALRVEHWSIPTDTGKRAGATVAARLAGTPLDPAPFAPMPSFWSDQYDQRLQSFGALGIADEVSVLEGELDGEFVAGYLRAGHLVGVAGVGLMPSLLRLRGELLATAAPAS